MSFTTYLTNNSEAYIADGGEIVYAQGGDDQIYVIPVDDSNAPFDYDFDFFGPAEVHGGDGDDLIVGYSDPDWLGYNILYGDNGNDTIHAGNRDDRSYGGAGNDIIWTGDGEDYVDGGSGDDTVYATDATNGDVLHGGSGTGDVLHLYHTTTESWNFSLVNGGSTYGLIADGFEELWFSGGDGVEVIEGGANTDHMWGGAGGDMLSGLGGDDGLWGEEGADILNGGDGNDHVDGGTGDDLLYGGNGTDDLDGGMGNDSLRGDAGDDVLHGDAGDDTIRDGIGNDTVYGDGGNDTIRTGTGSDEVWGGSGDDVIVEETADATVYFNGIPLYIGDTLHGGSGDDTINAGGGHDRLYGDGDDDILNGGAGDDLLVGGTGIDALTGGTGADVFAWNNVTESQAAGATADVITDFNRAAGDRIDLSAVDANDMLGGNQAFTFVGVVDFNTNNFTAAGQIGYFTSATDTYILINTRVDAGTDFEEMTIRVSGVHTVDASWFVL